jgi:demethylmenaquinone methyltransferase/2-methoxy-6-polyprenyl-1,4-benzoquinol methylase
MQQRVLDDNLQEMIAYYHTRAPEYDDWFYQRGRYDRGPDITARWFGEVEQVVALLDALHLTGDVLELAAGTGIWTERIVRTARSVTAVDASSEMIALNRARVDSNCVSYIMADLFAWRPDRLYDSVVFGFWLSHVPIERVDAFLELVASALRPGGTLFFVDSRREPDDPAADREMGERFHPQLVTRRLGNGQTFHVVKNFHDPDALTVRCARAGLDVVVGETATYFLYGTGMPSHLIR